MSVPTERKFPARSQEKGVFRKRLAETLRLRMYPHTGLQVKQLAAAIGVSDDTIHHWLRGENAPDGDNIGSLIRFFATLGDHGFIAAIFPEGVEPLVQRKREADAALQFVSAMKATFRQLEAVA